LTADLASKIQTIHTVICSGGGGNRTENQCFHSAYVTQNSLRLLFNLQW